MLSKTMALLLGIIAKQPVNAYEINKTLSVMHVRHWCSIASSTVYATLKAAEKKGYISGTMEKSGNMPDKTIYSITADGRNEFIKTIKSFMTDFSYDITPFHIAIFFIDFIDKEDVISILEKRIILLEKYEDGVARQIESMKKGNLPEIYILDVRQSLYIVKAQLKGTAELLEALKK